MSRKNSATIDLKVRMKEPLRAKLAASAKARGVSLNAEAVRRMDGSFSDESAVYREFGDEPTYSLMKLLASVKQTVEQMTGRSWREDAYTSEQAQKAMLTVLKTLVPPQKKASGGADAIMRAAQALSDEHRKELVLNLGASVAQGWIDQVRASDGTVRNTPKGRRSKDANKPDEIARGLRTQKPKPRSSKVGKR